VKKNLTLQYILFSRAAGISFLWKVSFCLSV